MAYEKQYFRDGEILMAEQLNHIEEGIVSLEEAGGGTGDPGVGIESIEQTTTSTEDGGQNIITATLTDGSTSEFVVRNGSKGSDGEKGDTGVGIQNVAQTTTSAEPGGENVITFILTDGTVKEFAVRNGMGTTQIVEISEADYELLSEEDKNSEEFVYFVPDGNSDGSGGSVDMGNTDISKIGDGTVTGAIGALNDKTKIVHFTETTGTGNSVGGITIQRTKYPGVLAIIPTGYDVSSMYKIGLSSISDGHFGLLVQNANSNAWANGVTVSFYALVVY